MGRLDAETSGLLVLTNDGDLAHVLAHPSFGVTKVYIAKVSGRVTPQTIATLTRGIELDDGPVHPDAVRLGARTDARTMVTVVLHEGRNRIVRRMFDAVGHPVRRLTRIQIGSVRMGQVRSGELRDLTRDELGALMDAVGL